MLSLFWCENKCLENRTKACYFKIKRFIYLFPAVSSSAWAPILTPRNKSVLIEKYPLFPTAIHQKVLFGKRLGFCILEENPILIARTENLFDCEDSTFISALYVCDKPKDCSGERTADEIQCVCNFTNCCPKTWENLCPNYTTMSPVKKIKHKLVSYPNSPEEPQENCSLPALKTFQCYSNKTTEKVIPLGLVDDLVVDCHSDGEDELILKETLNGNFYPCRNMHQIPCRDGHTLCVNVSLICSYQLSSYGFLMPCRTGEHLKQCKRFQCNGQSKCPKFYCIPWHYECDGKWDCPCGMDESNGTCIQERKCANLFRCKGSSFCVHMHHICDHVHQCPMGDDENLCNLHTVSCSTKCDCFTYSISCQSTTVTNFMQLDKFKFVHLFNCLLPFEYSFVSQNMITVVCMQANLTRLCWLLNNRNNIQTLNFAQNRISALKNFCFAHTGKLIFLDMSNNVIASLQTNTFSKLR